MNTTITIRTNMDIKRAAQARAEQLGLSLSDVINNSLRRFVKGRKVVYEDYYSKEQIDNLVKLAKEVDYDYKHGGKNIISFKNNDEAIEYLRDITRKKRAKIANGV
jgi:antitoxin component of RelBE/YafQ-DinJ toxin-antitoxin module